jgi:hypothetical protein
VVETDASRAAAESFLAQKAANLRAILDAEAALKAAADSSN